MAFFYRTRDTIESIIAGSILFMLVAAVVALILWLSSFSCHKRWEDSGMEVRYLLSAGCQVKVNGKWMPATTIRNF